MNTQQLEIRNAHYLGEVIERVSWTVKDVAQIFGVRTHTVRYWSHIFGIYPKKNKNGHRSYGADDIEKISEVYRLLKVERYTIEGAKMRFGKKNTPMSVEQ